ncbi:MAG TPA: serine hydrolase [Acidimicrobiales bacterium]|nr:serine hydrolase [Acidimicrobiales bacterium]
MEPAARSAAPTTGLDRRRLLEGGAAVVLAVALGGCSRSSGADDEGTAPGGGGEGGTGSETTAAGYVPGPGDDWATVDPADAGWDPAGLDAVVDFVAGRSSTSLLVVSGGRIVVERYWGTGAADVARDIASCQKSVVSTLCGVARDQGLLDLDEPVSTYLPAGWSRAERGDEAAITVRHLLSMTSGLDPRTLTKVAGPGRRWAYNTAAYQKLRPALEAVTGDGIEALTRRWLWDPLGVSERSLWSPRAGRGHPGRPAWALSMTARDMARFGLLVQRSGDWGGDEVVPADWFAEALRPSQDRNPLYGYLWWLLGRQSGDDVPDDLVAALGARDQKVYACPSLDLVVVRQGPAAREAAEARTSFDDELLARLLAARA